MTRICTWARLLDAETDGALYIYNLHLDHESQESRERSVGLLAERIASREFDDPVIVMGDFNAGESNPAILYFKGEGGQILDKDGFFDTGAGGVWNREKFADGSHPKPSASRLSNNPSTCLPASDILPRSDSTRATTPTNRSYMRSMMF